MNITSPCRAALVLTALLLVAVGGCGSNPKVFDQLGGMSKVNALAERFVGNVAADSRTSSWLAGEDLTRLTAKTSDQLCAMTGGECQGPLTPEQISRGARKFDDSTAQAIVSNFSKAVASLNADVDVTSALNNAIAPKMPGVLGALLQ